MLTLQEPSAEGSRYGKADKQHTTTYSLGWQIVGEEMALRVPKIALGTGKEQNGACFATLDNWDLQDKVCGMVFDSTASIIR